MSELMDARLSGYLDGLVPPRAAELQAMEAHARETDFPIIGPVCGYLCYQLARMVGARNVFELGSGYGYSTAWFARAVAENGGGRVHHVVWDTALSQRARGHLAKLGYEGIVKYHVAEAVQTLRKTNGPFDVIFNDIDKEGYPDSLPVIADKLRPGGILIVDNVLWSGRIFDDANQEASTEAIRRLTRHLANDPAWIVSLLPLRDGLLVAYKK